MYPLDPYVAAKAMVASAVEAVGTARPVVVIMAQTIEQIAMTWKTPSVLMRDAAVNKPRPNSFHITMHVSS